MNKVLFKISKYFLIFVILVFGACEQNSEAKDDNESNEDVPKITITIHKNDGSGETIIQKVPENATVTLSTEIPCFFRYLF